MPAKLHPTAFIPPFIKSSLLDRKLPWLIGLLAVAGLAAYAVSYWSAVQVSASNPLTPALRLAAGTVNLESTDQAVDAASAAKLLPLWQLLAQLNGSGSAAPQEITAVVEEIQLNMTAAQIQAIEAMQISQTDVSASVRRVDASSSVTSAQAAAPAGAEPVMGGDMPADAPPIDSGPASSAGSAQSTSSAQGSTSDPTPAIIRQVIRMLQNKAQG